MSSYPMKAADGGYECQAWHCGTGKDWCLSGLHFTEEEARRCMEQAVSDD